MADQKKHSNSVGSDVLSDSSFAPVAPLLPPSSETTFNLPLMPDDSQGAQFIQKGNYIIRGCGRPFEVENVSLVDVEIPQEEIDAEILANKVDSVNNSIADNNSLVAQMEGEKFEGEKSLKLLFKLIEEEEKKLLERDAELEENEDAEREALEALEAEQQEALLETPEATELSNNIVPVMAVDDAISALFAEALFPFTLHVDEYDISGPLPIGVTQGILLNDSFSGSVTLTILQQDINGFVDTIVPPVGDHLHVIDSITAPFQPGAGDLSVITYQITDGVTSDIATLTINWL